VFFPQREKISHELDAATAKLEALEASHQSRVDFDADVEAHRVTLSKHAEQHAAIARDIQDKTNDILKVKNEQRLILSRVETGKKKLKELERAKLEAERKIAEIAERNNRDTSHLDEKREKDRKVLLDEKEQLEVEKQRVLEEVNELGVHGVELRQEESELREGTTAVQQKLNRYHSDLKQLERESSASSAAAANAPRFNSAFGMATNAIWGEIKKAKWTHEPIGPLGEYVKVKSEDQRWLVAVTECLSRKDMSTYVVDNFDDQRHLQTIIDKVWRTIDRSHFKPNVMVHHTPHTARTAYTAPPLDLCHYGTVERNPGMTAPTAAMPHSSRAHWQPILMPPLTGTVLHCLTVGVSGAQAATTLSGRAAAGAIQTRHGLHQHRP
jgi:chromosome segregation ATPase